MNTINNTNNQTNNDRKEKLSVGDTAYIIESNRLIREVTIVRLDRDFCTIRFADSGGAIKVRRSRLYGTRKLAEESLPKKKICKPRFEGPRPPHRIW